jgi:Zn finger protein HypA/HybF involved in hydrogenase expression
MSQELLMNVAAKQVKCQECSPFAGNLGYMPCMQPATYLVATRDARPYLMCDGCTSHNVQNRGGEIIAQIIPYDPPLKKLP